jgi:[ribosomal protein S18]-alanine N-acetyltransferase
MALSHANPARDAGPPAQGPSDWPSVGEADRITLAQEQRRAVFAPLTMDDLDAVHAVEKSAYAHPWSRKHFVDSVQAGHPAMMLLGEALPDEVVFPQRPDGRVLLGYLVAMPGVEEMHLLNITVAPAHQRQGWARLLLDALVLWSRGQGAQWLWLEVRASNTAARRLYERYGFRQVGVRKGYYPAGQFQREDAIVMNHGLLHPAAEGEVP